MEWRLDRWCVGWLVAVFVASACTPGSGTVDAQTSATASPAGAIGAAPGTAPANGDCSGGLELKPAESIVFLQPDATPEQTEQIRRALVAGRNVGDVRFVSRDEAYAELQGLLAESEMRLTVRREDLPTSFRIEAADEGAAADQLRRAVEGMPVVRKVVVSEGRCITDLAGKLQAARRAVDGRYGDADLFVWLEPSALDDAIPRLRSHLLAMPVVKGLTFVSQEAALDEFRCLMADSPDLTAEVGAEDLPPSFRVDLGDDLRVAASVVRQLRGERGVKKVTERPSAAELLAEVVSTGNDDVEMLHDCPVRGERLK